MATNLPIMEMLQAKSLHNAYLEGLKNLSKWYKRGNNIYKTELALIINNIIEQKSKGWDDENNYFPEISEIKASIRYNEFLRFSDDGIEDDFIKVPYNLNFPYDNITNLDSVFFLNAKNELNAKQLCDHLQSNGFITKFNGLPFFTQARYINTFTNRLTETFIGRKFLMNNQLGELPIVGFFHYSRLREHTKKLDKFFDSNKDKDIIKELEKDVEYYKLYNDVRDNTIKIAPLVANKILNTNSKIVKDLRAIILESFYVLIKFRDATIKKPFKKFCTDVLILSLENDSLDDFIKGIEKFKNYLLGIKPKFLKKVENNKILKPSWKGVFNTMYFGVSLLGLATSVYSQHKNPSIRGKLQVSMNLTFTLEAANSAFGITQNANVLKYLKIGVGIANILGSILCVIDAIDALEKGDESVAIGYSSLALAGLAIGLMELGLLEIATGVLAVKGIIVVISGVGLYLVFMTQNPLMEEWLTHNYFGINWENEENDSNPDDLIFYFDRDYKRQIIKFHTLIDVPEARVSSDKRSVSTLEDFELKSPVYGGHTIPLLDSIKNIFDENYGIDNWYWNDHFFIVDIFVSELLISAEIKRIEFKVKFWDNESKYFLWPERNDIITVFPFESIKTSLPENWNSSNVLFLEYLDVNIIEKEKEVKIDGNEKSQVFHYINFGVKLLVSKSLIRNSLHQHDQVRSRLTHAEIDVSFSHSKEKGSIDSNFVFGTQVN